MFSRRLSIAAACALVLHAVAVSLIPRQRPVEVAQEAIVARVTLARIARTPAPRPAPRPTPTPTPPPHTAIAQLPAGLHARVERIKHAGAKRPTPPKAIYATPDAAIPTGGSGAGAQNGSDAGSLSATNGSGSGTGNAGNGQGAGAQPCGAIDFEAIGEAQYNSDSGYYERKITATVYYTDGSYEKISLDWPWRYKSEDDDPFAPTSDTPFALFQFPPAAQRATEPPVVQYIITHTSSNGRTTLRGDCPNIPPVGGSPGPERHP